MVTVMKCRNLVLLVAFAGCLLAGCTSFDQDNFDAQVRKWVPIGTPLKEARHTMEHHGFDCELIDKDNPLNHEGGEFLDCEKNAVWFHTWTAQIFLKDGKVSGYGSQTVE